MLWGLVWLIGCGGASRERVVVLAASSLVGPLEQLEARFEASNPEIDLVISYAGSHTLAHQVRQGMQAQVFASADGDLLRALAQDGLSAGPLPLATNQLVLAAQGPEPTLEDLRTKRVVLAAPQVPIGRYTTEALGAALLDEMSVVSFEPSVRRVTARIANGDAPLGVIYQTELSTHAGQGLAGRPLGKQVTVEVSTLTHATAHGDRFFAFLLSDEAQEVFGAHGFGQP